MLALTVRPGMPGTAILEEVEEEAGDKGEVLVQTLAIGICGTDREIVRGEYGTAPPAAESLILGHESLGRVVAAPSGSGFGIGDLVVGIVRKPDPVPCENCAAGEWDMCLNGLFTEHGIRQLHGFCRERFSMAPEFLVKLGPELASVGILTEPASILAKAWEQIRLLGQRARRQPRRALVTGAGPIGLIAALMGVESGLEVHVFDRVTEGPKPALVRDLGATYHVGDLESACSGSDVVLECTGVGQIVLEVMRGTSPNGIVCLTGITSGNRKLAVDVAAWNRGMVLENDVVFGTVNANRRHYEIAASFLARTDRAWLERLLTRRVPLRNWAEALQPLKHDVKTIIDFTVGF